MKNYISLTVLVLLGSLLNQGCDRKSDSDLVCEPITLNKPFLAKIGEEWCIPSSGWSITFGPFMEDSRCNVPYVDCVWAGRYVMGARIKNGETVLDTFEAIHNWSDTLYSGPYSIILKTVKPEIRSTMEPLDPSEYSFDMIVR